MRRRRLPPPAPRVRRTRLRASGCFILVAAALLVSLLGACAGSRAGTGSSEPSSSDPSDRNAGSSPAAADGSNAAGLVVASNVLREDYAGSASCTTCHAEEAERWARSPMHRMTRNLPEATVTAPFDGRTIRFKGDSAVLVQRGAKRFMRIDSPAFGGVQTYEVTRVIGGHHREDFVGVPSNDVAVAPSSSSLALGTSDPREVVLPLSYLIGAKKFRYKGYSVMSRERPGLKAGPVWSETCIFCHNTQPYMLSLLGALSDKQGGGYQGLVVDRLLPQQARFRYVVTDEDALARHLDREMVHIGGATVGGSTSDRLVRAMETTRRAFGGEDLVEVGIGCEACHGGSVAHVRDAKVRPSLLPRGDFFRIQRAGASSAPCGSGCEKKAEDPRAIATNRVCARCHQVLFSRYPFTWEGETRDGARPGGSHINSGEGRDFLLGGCAGSMTCTRCHDPHGDDNAERATHLETREGDVVCLGCHGDYRSDARLAQHTHHGATSTGSRCLACHMPRKNMALDGTLGRYHRIGAPTDAEKVLGDRPLECALCHASQSIESLVSTMERWYGKTYERAPLEALYGDLRSPAMLATLRTGKPHEKAVALFVLGEARDRGAVPFALRELQNPFPLVRGYAEGALEKILGAPSPLDLGATDDDIARQAKAWVAAQGPTTLNQVR